MRRKKIELNPFKLLARRKILQASGGRVIAGPFAGLRYVSNSVGSMHAPKLLGTYELELRPCIEELCRRGFKLIVNIGAAEGYYAVGLALRCPGARVVAYEMDPAGQELVTQMAAMNSVADRVSVQGCCDVSALNECLAAASDSLLIVDVEGEEQTLLDPRAVPQLQRAFILVEMHDYLRPGLSDELQLRFQTTHDFERIVQRPRLAADLPIRSRWLNPWLARAMNEKRPREAQPMHWFCLRPRAAI